MPLSKNELEQLKTRGLIFRASAVDKSIINKDERSIRTVIATETPSIVIDWDEWEIVREILLCDSDSVILPEEREVPLLNSHRSGDAEHVIGSIRELNVENKEVVGRSFFSSVETEIWTKVEEGHIRNTSAGYEVFREFTVRIPAGGSTFVKGVEYRNDYPDKYTLVIRTKWKLREGSAVALGADENSNFRNSSQNQFQESNSYTEILSAIKAEREKIENLLNHKSSFKSKEANVPEEKPKSQEEILKEERERQAEIRKTGKRFVGRINDIDKLIDDAIDKGYTVERFNGEIVSRLSSGEEFSTPVTDLELDGKDKKRYSIWNLVRAHMEGKKDIAGLEREASDAIAEKLGRQPRENAYFVEYGHLRNAMVSKRAEITVGAGTADALVATELKAEYFLDLLYNEIIIGNKITPQIIYGAVGDLEFPRKTSSSTAYYVGESEAAAESDINFGKIKLTPRTISALVRYSRKTAQQTTPAMEGIVLQDILTQLSQKANYGYINGQGTNEPSGLLNWDGVQLFDGTGFNYDKALDMLAVLEDANVRSTNLFWLAKPAVRSSGRKKKIETGQVDRLVMNNKMLDYDFLTTGIMPDNTLALFDPSDFIIVNWGILEIQVNRWNDDGGVKVIPFWDHDFASRRPVATVKTSALSFS